MTLAKSIAWFSASLAALALIGLALVRAEPPAEEVARKPSSYAPAKDLEYQVEYLIDRLEKDLKDASKYERRIKRVVRNANTIAAVALVMGNHDQDNDIKGRTASVIEAASHLAAKAACHAHAKIAFDKLVSTVNAPPESQQVPWKSVGDIEQLMLQIPQLERSLKTAVQPSRFAKSPENAASLAATIAAVAQISMFDDTYCRDAGDCAEWVELCACLRDAAKDVHSAIQEGDQEAAVESLQPLARTCDDCHDQFQD